MNTNGSCPITECIPSGTAIAVLAAGRASRFGGGKLDVELNGKPLGRWVCDTAGSLPFGKRIVITAPIAPSFVQPLGGWTQVTNPHADLGIGTSIAAAAKAAMGRDRLLIALADMPLVSAAHLQELATAIDIAFTEYPGGRLGVPAAFPSRCFERLGQLTGDEGAAKLDWREQVSAIAPREPEELSDVDTEDALERLRATTPR